jgi:nitrate/TMAO reductase-like tetraheme cytochrome c subunit
MLKRFKRRFSGSLEKIIEHFTGFILAMIILIGILGVVVGYRYYRYTQEEPQYCASCHLMKEAFTEWERGKHRDVVCQTCHQLNIFEQNQLLIAFVLKKENKPFSQTHGRKKPWNACKKCHLDEVSQGAVTLRKSFGHARHVFMEKIDCKVCHKGTVHDFHPNENACKVCHQNKGVHGVGMEAFSCLKCHVFSEKTPSMIPKNRCTSCHKNIPKTGPMSGLHCHQCHRPHSRMIPSSETCATECHRMGELAGQHILHAEKGLKCLDCHKAHTWTVGEANAKTLCSHCHIFRNPKLFVY